jgi:hypothetical protein
MDVGADPTIEGVAILAKLLRSRICDHILVREPKMPPICQYSTFPLHSIESEAQRTMPSTQRSRCSWACQRSQGQAPSPWIVHRLLQLQRPPESSSDC